MKTPHGRTEINAVFGNPAKANGTLNKTWQDQNIQVVKPPGAWKLFFQQSKTSLIKVSGISMHKLLADSFRQVLEEIWQHAQTEAGAGATDDQIRAWLHERRLDVHGGGFEFRPITGGANLSLHSFGIAIDWDPLHNPRQKPLKFTLPEWWYEIWKKHGWSDGRHFSMPDPMHVQFATGA